MMLRAASIQAVRFYGLSPVTRAPAAYLPLSVRQEGGLGGGLAIYRALAGDMSWRVSLSSPFPIS